MSEIEGKATRVGASEWSRRASRDIDGKTERSNGREHMSQRGQRANFNTFNENLDLGTSALKARPLLRSRYGAYGPVDGDAFAGLGDELSGDDF